MEEVVTFLKTFDSKSKVVIAVSGGPDSMALFDLIFKNFDHNNIICAHVNHGLRVESLEEKEYVEALCLKNEVKFEYLEIKSIPKGNFHHEARKIRYAFFEEIVNKYNAGYLLTAHHADDALENIILRLQRGTTNKGLIGMSLVEQRRAYLLARPLLNVTKEQILQYCDQQKINYFIDKSNYTNKYKRNYIRNEVIPLLKKENENLVDLIVSLSSKMASINRVLERLFNISYSLVVLENKINIPKIKNMPLFVRSAIVRKWLLENYQGDIEYINNKHIKIIEGLINKPGNRFNFLPMNKKVYRVYENIIIESGERLIKPIDIIIKESKTNVLENTIEVLNQQDFIDFKIDNNITFLSKDIKLPLIIKNIDLDAHIILKNSNMRKKIKRIMIDDKISILERKEKIMIVDQNGEIVWIPGIKKTKYDVYPNGNYGIILRYY